MVKNKLNWKRLLFVSFFLLSQAWGGNSFQSCQYEQVDKWSIPPELKESSGLAYLRKEVKKLVQVNDSGNDAELFLSDLRGKDLQVVRLDGVENIDFEDLSYAPCPKALKGMCLYVADSGDNLRSRDQIFLHIIREDLIRLTLAGMKTPGQKLTLTPDLTVSLSYKDGITSNNGIKTDSESLAIVTNEMGEGRWALFLSKERGGFSFFGDNESNGMHHFLAADLSLLNFNPKKGQHLTASKLASWDLGKLLSDPTVLPTAMDLDESGRFLLILTYSKLLKVDLSSKGDGSGPLRAGSLEKLSEELKRPLVLGKNAQLVSIETQKQQEAVAFTERENFVVSSEKKGSFLLNYSCSHNSLRHQ